MALSLSLSSEQVEFLAQDAKIDLNDFYLINGTVQNPPAIVQGYTNGWMVIFTDGDSTEHVALVTSLLGAEYAREPLFKGRGFTIYAGSLYKFRGSSNKVTVVTMP